MAFDPIGWGKKNIINPLAGVSEEGPTRAERNWSEWDYQVGEDPTERAMLQKGMDMQKGLARSYQDAVGGPAQIRMPNEGNPAQLAAGRRRRNDQYAAAGLPGVGFDPGLEGQRVDGPAKQAGTGSVQASGLARAVGQGYGMSAAGRDDKKPGPTDDSNMGRKVEDVAQTPAPKTNPTRIPRIEKERK